MWIIIRNADCFFQKIQERSLELVILTSTATDSDANGHRPHYKTPLFFTRLGFIQAITLIRSNRKWCITGFADSFEKHLLVFILYCNNCTYTIRVEFQVFPILKFPEKWNHGSYRNVPLWEIWLIINRTVENIGSIMYSSKIHHSLRIFLKFQVI